MHIGLISCDEGMHTPAFLYISSFLRLHGHSTRLLFMRKFPLGADVSSSFTKDFFAYSEDEIESVREWGRKCDLLGISCMSLNAQRTHQLVKVLKQSDVPLVWGGPHATGAPEDCLQSADIICRGEGEEALLELADTLECGGIIYGIKNLWIRGEHGVHRNEVRPLTENLDSFGGHDFDISHHYVLDRGSIRRVLEGDVGPVIYLNMMRGCRFQCNFCGWSLHHRLYKGKGKRVRKRTPESIVSETHEIVRRFPHVEMINFQNDDDFFFTVDEVRRFADGWKQHVQLPFTIQGSPLTLTREKLELFVDAGLKVLAMGIQSGSDKVLKKYNRPMYREHIVRAAELLSEYAGRIQLYYDALYNSPYEEPKDLVETLNLVRSMKPPFYFHPRNLTYLPGTDLHKELVVSGGLGNNHASSAALSGYDVAGHLEQKGGCCSPYLVYLLSICHGPVTGRRIGYVPRLLMPLLCSDRLVRLFGALPTLTGAMRCAYRFARFTVRTGKHCVRKGEHRWGISR